MSSVLELLQRTGSFIDSNKPRGRGQPSLDDRSLDDLLRRSLPFRVAYEVAVEVERLGGKKKRGSVAEAIRRVASTYSKQRDIKRPYVSPIQVQTYFKRYCEKMQALANSENYFYEIKNELESRTMGFPDDVAKALNEAPGVALLQWLRDNNIDGTCPIELIAAIRNRTSD